MRRECGDCQLCCRLLPVLDNEPWRDDEPINKPAGVRCRHQSHAKGCKVYNTRAMPFCCTAWTCRWLTNNDMADQSRPDRSHLVVDVMPDYITIRHDDGEPDQKVQVVQVWCDPRFPDAHRDPAFRRYLERVGEEGIAALIRYNERDAITIIPPALAPDGQFHEIDDKTRTRVERRTQKELREFFSGANIVTEP